MAYFRCGGKPEEEKTAYWNDETLVVTPTSGKTMKKVTVKKPVLTGITITTQPTKKSYQKGESFDPSGMVVTASYNNGTSKAVIGYTYSPATFTTTGTATVTISYTENGVTKTASLTVSVSAKIVTWAGGTDEEIADMVAAADAGQIDLSNYWAVGDERSASLLEMAATGVGESHVAQTVKLVLMDTTCTGFTLASATASGRTKPSFIVGMKNSLVETGYMNSTNTNSNGWSGAARRTWCNNIFRMAIPTSLRGAFKQFKWKQGKGGGVSSGLLETTDYFGLPPEKVISGSSVYSQTDEAALYSQWEWYKTASNRIKKLGETGSANAWWECSPYSGYPSYFCCVDSGGRAAGYNASIARGLAPFGCI